MTENNWAVGGKYLDFYRAKLVSGAWQIQKKDGSGAATGTADRIVRLKLVVTAEWIPNDDGTFSIKLDQDHDDNTMIDDVLYAYAWTPINASTSSEVSERKYRDSSKKGGASASSSDTALVAVDYGALSEDGVEIKLAGALSTLLRTSGGWKSKVDEPSSPQYELKTILPPADLDLFTIIDGTLVKKTGGGTAISSFVQKASVGLKVKYVPVP
ncbi:MAG: hypothetical protein JNL32_06850 [Candidatus Kapabacteria bacterium]|nr:hypothetical protein [Candidatus Kapabacteria bacterium]